MERSYTLTHTHTEDKSLFEGLVEWPLHDNWTAALRKAASSAAAAAWVFDGGNNFFPPFLCLYSTSRVRLKSLFIEFGAE
jgi:hypothetical protein